MCMPTIGSHLQSHSHIPGISLQESRALVQPGGVMSCHLPFWWVPNSYLPCCFLFTSHTAFFFFSSGKTSPWLCVHKSWGQRGLSFIEARGLCWIMSCLNSNVCFSKPSKLLDLTCTTAKRGQKTPYFAWKVKYSSFVMALLREWKMWGEILIPDILLGPRLIHVRALYTLLAAWRDLALPSLPYCCWRCCVGVIPGLSKQLFSPSVPGFRGRNTCHLPQMSSQFKLT